jgi:predicted dehydrogenase
MKKPRLGFVGLGWIGRNRLEAVVQADVAEVRALQDVSEAAVSEAQKLAPDALVSTSFEELLQQDLDGVVIATPNRFHAEQAIAALERGFAVFCQKPLGRTASETRTIVEAAQRYDRRLGVDLSYRNIRAMQIVSWLVETGALGKVFAVDAVFHNAYGPDKPWFYDFSLAGGGCVLDLGVHLIDLALAPLRYPRLKRIDSSLYARGRLITKPAHQVEDYAVAKIDTTDSTTINLSCSWNLHAGREAKIGLTFYGTGGGASLRNVDGSFYDFVAERFNGTETETLNTTADSNWQWGGLATLEWVKQLANSSAFDPKIERVIDVAEVIDQIYGRS